MLPSFDRPDLARDALSELVAVRGALDALEIKLVASLRARGGTWVELAEILGVTPQGASKRHRTRARGGTRDDGGEPFVPFVAARRQKLGGSG